MNTAELLICVVDDDEGVLRSVRRLLRAAGFATAETFTSAEAFLEAGPVGPDCLVLDVHLRGLSGFDLQDRLSLLGRSIPIVFITALDDAATRERAERAGGAEYLCKPFEDQRLIEAIHKVVDRAPHRDTGAP